MTTARLPLWALLAISIGMGSGQARAEDPLGFYVGGAVGHADIRDDQSTAIGPLGFSEHDTGWKAMAGVRPIPVIGAEVEYIDFGNPSASYGLVSADVHQTATALFGVGYLPLLPPFSVYAKAGIARVTTSASGTVSCPSPLICFARLQQDRTDDGQFAYGAGAQIKLASFAVRAEYERINDGNGSPDLLSLGLTWTF